MRKRRTTVEIAREAEMRSAFGFPFRAYFGDMGFAGRGEPVKRATRRKRTTEEASK